MLSFSIYTMPIYAALILSVLGLGSRHFMRLHITMGTLSLATLSAVEYLFTLYPYTEDSFLVGAFGDGLFGAILAVVFLRFDKPKFGKNEGGKAYSSFV